MKKYLFLTLLLPTALLVASGAANAQRRNTTSHTVTPKADCICQNEVNCPCSNRDTVATNTVTKDEYDTTYTNHHEPRYNRHNKDAAYYQDMTPYYNSIREAANERLENTTAIYKKVMKKIAEEELSPAQTQTLQDLAKSNLKAAQKHLSSDVETLISNHQECMDTGVKHKLCTRIDKILFSKD